MPDINQITISGMVVSTWSYDGDLFATVAMYDNQEDEDAAGPQQVLAALKEQGVSAEKLARVSAVLDTPPSEQERRQRPHYATVRFPDGQDPEGNPLTIQHGVRLFVTGYYHEARAYQNLLGAARRCGIAIDSFPQRVRQALGDNAFPRPAPHIVPEGLTLLGHIADQDTEENDSGNAAAGDDQERDHD
jgi:hypothetical protein